MKFKVGDVVFARFEKQYGVVYQVNETSAWPYSVRLLGTVPVLSPPRSQPWRKILVDDVNEIDTRRRGEYVPNELHRAVVSFVGPVDVEEKRHGSEVQGR